MTNIVGQTNQHTDPPKYAGPVDIDKNKKLLAAYEEFVHKINVLKKQKFEAIVSFRQKLDEAKLNLTKAKFEGKFK